ncbi:MAG TPA: baseplate J/gp47 family protein [Chloroflexota bacterium]|nr:baseplate J/gp47 family protein [Chloroflexota bacterium]
MAGGTYIDVTVETDPELLAQEALEYLAVVVPGFDPAEGNLEQWLVRAQARIAAEVRDLAADVPAAIFRKFGADLVNLPPVDAAPARVASTWTMRDTAGYTIPSGTVVSVKVTGDQSFPFQTVADVTVAPGASVTAAGAVLLEQVLDTEAGGGGASASGVTATATLVDVLDFVLEPNGIALVGATYGGADAEEDDAYLNRLRRKLQLLSPRPILPRDFAVLAQDVAGVWRALAIDLYDPAFPDVQTARAVSIAAVGTTGVGVAQSVKDAVKAYLETMREANFRVFTIDPTSTAVGVTATVKAKAGAITSEVDTAVTAALTAYLSPATWGIPTDGDGRDWVNVAAVYYLEVATVINNVENVDRITALTVNGGTADVALAGKAPLPSVGVIDVTVTT